jgi:hypothetical protein
MDEEKIKAMGDIDRELTQLVNKEQTWGTLRRQADLLARLKTEYFKGRPEALASHCQNVLGLKASYGEKVISAIENEAQLKSKGITAKQAATIIVALA